MARLILRFVDQGAVDEFVRRLVFVIASGNGDAHLKNWSLVYPDGIQARWSPLYDQVATVVWNDRALALNLAGVKDFGRIDRVTFGRFASKAGIDERKVLDLVDETLDRLRAVWRTVAADLPLPTAHAEALKSHWRKVPFLRSAGALE